MLAGHESTRGEFAITTVLRRRPHSPFCSPASMSASRSPAPFKQVLGYMVSAYFQGTTSVRDGLQLRAEQTCRYCALIAPLPVTLVSSQWIGRETHPKEFPENLASTACILAKIQVIATGTITAPHNYNGQSRERGPMSFFDRVLLPPGRRSAVPLRRPRSPRPARGLLDRCGACDLRTLPQYRELFDSWRSNARKK